MGLLDSLLSEDGLLSDVAGFAKENPQILAAAAALLNPDDSSIGGKNGLTEVLASLQFGGLGEIAQSWLSQGPNQRVSADQLGSVLGDDVVAQFGQRAGVGAGDAGSVLAGILPELVNQMSPKGQAPDSPDLGNLLGGLLKGLS